MSMHPPGEELDLTICYDDKAGIGRKRMGIREGYWMRQSMYAVPWVLEGSKYEILMNDGKT
ncbi:hypothetical protein B0T17DRAFT_546884 [Bombardia bombarda]|uniref:Uncharacterized protein n=1 Tax=Bombardia bombarda TaxID=252184 RepID=A0AA39T0G7_9PEZI|nr:hypothetical protein B0T17DRAFT_546884 [Bombardia bombarda]